MGRCVPVAFLVAAVLALGERGLADTFTHKTTGRVIKGSLLGSVTREGKKEYLVRPEGEGIRLLPATEWDVVREPRERPRPPEWPIVIYNGKARSAAWLERHYKQFRDKIALVDGKYYDTGSSHLWASYEGSQPGSKEARNKPLPLLALGDCARISLRVLRVPAKGEIIGWVNWARFPWPGGGKLYTMWRDRKYAKLIRVKGVPTDGVVTDATVNFGPLIVVGTCNYAVPDKEAKTIFDCRPLPAVRPPLTRAQFAKALESGFQLAEWQQRRKKMHDYSAHKEVWRYWWERVPVK